MVNNRGSLLDIIAKECKCYISDLQLMILYDKKYVYIAVKEIPSTQFTADEWNNAITYLFDSNSNFRSSYDAKNDLLKRLSI